MIINLQVDPTHIILLFNNYFRNHLQLIKKEKKNPVSEHEMQLSLVITSFFYSVENP